MGIFTRFRDIISANINSMLDKAEDPDKLIKLMIREMEDTLVELKAACAQVMAERQKIQRRTDDANSRLDLWQQRAKLAVDKGRDDLAREALKEKRRYSQTIASLEKDLIEQEALVDQYQADIRQLEEKLAGAREKQRMLVQRHLRARRHRRAQEEIRRADSYETIAKFEDLESRIDRMEAEADLVNSGRQTPLDEAFDRLLVDDDIERELRSLKSGQNGSDGPQDPLQPV